MCGTCGHRLPYGSSQRYCNRDCWQRRPQPRKVWRQGDVAQILAWLNSGVSLTQVADQLDVSRTTLYAALRDARIVRVGGSPYHPGVYAVVHWKNPRQLALF